MGKEDAVDYVKKDFEIRRILGVRTVNRGAKVVEEYQVEWAPTWTSKSECNEEALLKRGILEVRGPTASEDESDIRKMNFIVWRFDPKNRNKEPKVETISYEELKKSYQTELINYFESCHRNE